MTRLNVVPDNRPEKARPSAAKRLQSTLCLPGFLLMCESDEQLSAFLNTYTERFRPTNMIEMFEVERMVMARWRQRRYWQMEGALLDAQMEQQIAPDHPKSPTEYDIKVYGSIHNSARRGHKIALEFLRDMRARKIFK